MAYTVDSVADYYTPLKGQPTALTELQNYQPHQSPEVMLKGKNRCLVFLNDLALFCSVILSL